MQVEASDRPKAEDFGKEEENMFGETSPPKGFNSGLIVLLVVVGVVLTFIVVNVALYLYAQKNAPPKKKKPVSKKKLKREMLKQGVSAPGE